MELVKKSENWMTQQPWGKLVNRAGMTYRKLSDEEKKAANHKITEEYLLN
jgi:arsenate reductase-like glutaredoxin family protein